MAATILAILGAACIAYGLGIRSLGSGTGFFAVWIVAGVVLLILAVCTHFGLVARLPAVVRRVALACLGIAAAGLLVTGGLVVSDFGSRGRPGLDAIVVLGAQVREDGPSTVLRHRLDTACAYLEQNEGTLCIVSGGQGPNEPWSEARGMKDYLVEQGIDPARIIEEGSSTSTVENLANSLALLGEDPGAVGVVTNDFHVFRAVRIARRLGFADVCGIAAPSDAWVLPNNLLRECLGVGKDLVAGNL